jgi:hypothetical protein
MRRVLAGVLVLFSAVGNFAFSQKLTDSASAGTPNSAITQPSSCPVVPGVYYRSDAKWKLMEEIHSSGFHTTGIAKAAFCYGVASAKVKALFRAPRSPYQIRNPESQFCVVGMTDEGRDLTIVRLQEERDRRELETASMRMWTGVSSEVKDDQLLKIDVEKLADKIYLVTPSGRIPAGEYILFTIVPDTQALVKANTPSALGGYDFGFHGQ